jgi:hypothetical protein
LEYWKMITGFSEPGGSFQLEIITSNETYYQSSCRTLCSRKARRHLHWRGARAEFYLHRSTAASAFIFDIRRDMMLDISCTRPCSRCQPIVSSSCQSAPTEHPRN